ncbi:MAG: nucleotidyltransferase family protein [Cyclobacteriaceae bacterium]|nr:nucleotidyltransferase family protein [Cyclobacteriaceae bacterium]
MRVGIIILAAGSSSRLGKPKQLLKVNGGKTLLEKTTYAALDSGANPIIVVLGNQAEILSKIIQTLSVTVVTHKYWILGMGSSLKAGLQKLLNDHPETEAVIVTVCDQPYLTAEHLKKLITVYIHTSSQVVASHYNGIHGVPALFDKSLFQKLLELKDDEGARKIIRPQAGTIELVPFENGEIDIDTPDDLNYLTNNKD